MKKNIIFLSAIFLVVIIVTFLLHIKNNKLIRDNKQEGTTVASAVELDKNKKFYKMGETVMARSYRAEQPDYNICVNSAYLSTELDKDFAKHTNLADELEKNLRYYETHAVAFRDEFRLLYVDVTMENPGDKNTFFSLNMFKLVGVHENEVSGAGIRTTSFLKVNNDTMEHIISNTFDAPSISIPAKGKVNLRIAYIVRPNELYNVHLSAVFEGHSYNRSYIDLEIDVFETGFFTFDIGDKPYDADKRDAKAARIRNKVTKLDYNEKNQTGCFIPDRYLYKIGDKIGIAYEQAENERPPVFQMDIDEATLYDSISDLPSNFTEHNYLSDMTDVYVEESGNSPDDYRYLYVKANLKQLGNLGERRYAIEELMKIYNRDSEGKMWYIGYPVDYYILSSTNQSQVLGNTGITYTRENDEFVVEAVYIFPPDTIYDLYISNYDYILHTDREKDYMDETRTMPYALIDLNIKLKENGGVKN